ncbi:polysaccharide deacetylase family protein [Actinoplanes sp. CA-051413]|uniref:polysaccharide deacetylase family protein n=1 Tax=Actinoplanes sp. CA-051413 TaxID=3239899 RepID=UPI003D99F04A
MRTPKVLLLGLALSVLAGCGTAVAAESDPRWVSAAPATSAAPAPSRSTAEAPAPAPTRPARHEPAPAKPAAVPVKGPAPARKKPAKRVPAHAGGPAGSLMRTGGAAVALTFDDGPDPVQTPRMLDLLKQKRVKATFCVVGQNVAAYPGLVRRIAAEGHTLCNHTWRHSLTLGKKKPAVIRADLQRTNDAIRRAVPGARISYMRAPGGNFTPAFVAAAAELGMTSIYWQVDPRDWEHPGGESDAAHRTKVVHAVKKHVGKGAIVLSHDYGQPTTISAYRELIPWLQKRYRLVALPSQGLSARAG